ncbi:OLC1v1031692C1 [Oldenlandia corymbosa var. corymbosa]|uniref:OLC1v1031692C1 n=1 Tax=Oldenlandia corymbosa var. corymbosa TaxID=529605 RepID=A0AAV1CJ66_OLDCO|nr:OLC1v1031692C1 [Oldenlandia corymbosa var. corymbosa]
MSSSKDNVGLFGDAQIFEIKTSDDEGSSNKVTKKRKLRRLVKASDADAKSKKKKPHPETDGNPIPEVIPVTERHPEWFKPIEASLEKKNTVEDTDGSSTYTAAAAIYHFGDTIIEDVAVTLTEEESLKMLTTSMASILMREKKLKQEIASLRLEKGLLEQEKLTHEESIKEEQAMRFAKEKEIATVQAMYREVETKLTEYRESHVPKSDLREWMTAFWARIVPTGALASILMGISNNAKALGGHGVAVAALERMESGRTINAGWLQQFIKLHPKETLHEAIKNGLQQLFDGQLPLFRPLRSAVAQMGSSTEIASFEGDAPTVLPVDLGEEVHVPKLASDFIGVEVVWEEDSSKQVEEDEKNDQEPEKEGTSMHTPVNETNEKANISEEMEKLKKENARLRKRENIVVSPWFLEKFDTLALVEAQIKVCIERFIPAIDLLKKRTKEVEFNLKQAAILQNILVDHEISLPILEDLDPDDEAKEKVAAEEYLLRINEQDWEILDLKDKLSPCLHRLRVMGCSGVFKPSRFNLKGTYLKI